MWSRSTLLSPSGHSQGNPIEYALWPEKVHTDVTVAVDWALNLKTPPPPHPPTSPPTASEADQLFLLSAFASVLSVCFLLEKDAFAENMRIVSIVRLG